MGGINMSEKNDGMMWALVKEKPEEGLCVGKGRASDAPDAAVLPSAFCAEQAGHLRSESSGGDPGTFSKYRVEWNRL